MEIRFGDGKTVHLFFNEESQNIRLPEIGPFDKPKGNTGVIDFRQSAVPDLSDYRIGGGYEVGMEKFGLMGQADLLIPNLGG